MLEIPWKMWRIWETFEWQMLRTPKKTTVVVDSGNMVNFGNLWVYKGKIWLTNFATTKRRREADFWNGVNGKSMQWKNDCVRECWYFWLVELLQSYFLTCSTFFYLLLSMVIMTKFIIFSSTLSSSLLEFISYSCF